MKNKEIEKKQQSPMRNKEREKNKEMYHEINLKIKSSELVWYKRKIKIELPFYIVKYT